MKFFPDLWGNASFGESSVVPIPVGTACHACGNPIAESGPWARGCYVPHISMLTGSWVDDVFHRICFLKNLGIPDELIPAYDTTKKRPTAP